MKIAVVHWILNDVGGINSWTENFIDGLRTLGHKVQLYYGSHQRKLGVHPTEKVPRSRRFHLLPGKLASYHPDELTRSILELNKYELIVFAHPSPHPTKGNMECKEPRAWMDFYRETRPQKIAVFHDRHWDRTNEWISEVKEEIDYVHAAQHHFIPSVKKFCGSSIPYDWGYFPLNVLDELPKRKVRQWILATQWLALKNHRFLIPRLDELELPLNSYGSGQTYHKLLPEMKKVYREDHHQDEVQIYNRKSKHVHYGHTEYRLLMEIMAESWFSLDLSTQGMTNMTHWEPLTVGSISVMSKQTAEDRFNEIPEDCRLSFELESLLYDLNRIGRMPEKELRQVHENGFNFVQRCRSEKVAKKLLDNWEDTR